MKKITKLTFISLYVALALVFDYIKTFIPFLNMPSGGSINIALIPIVVCSFHIGIGGGLISGFLWWLSSSLLGLNNWFINIPQYLLDYIFPSIVPGLCSIFDKKNKIIFIELGIIVMMLIRTLCILTSGAKYWPDGVAANSLAAWSASCIYNLPYSIATTIMLMITVPIILKSINKH